MPMLARMLAASLALVVLAKTAYGEIHEFTVTINEAQAEVCQGTGSPATGFGYLTVDSDTLLFTYDITLQDLLSPELFSHIHGPAEPCDSAGFIYNLPLGSHKVGKDFLSPFQVADMINGLNYVLVHTDEMQNGEVRGQILPLDPVPATSDWGLAILGLALGVMGTALYRRHPSGGR